MKFEISDKNFDIKGRNNQIELLKDEIGTL